MAWPELVEGLLRGYNGGVLKFLITAGPTREYLDPARFLSNPSTGKMGYALAAAARKFSKDVMLISGPTDLPEPRGVKFVGVETAAQMARETLHRARKADIIILAAAVADYRPAKVSAQKMKKSSRSLTLRLVATRDIAATLGHRKRRGQVLVGFAAETNNLLANARKKLRAKNLDLIVANRIGRAGSGFGSDTNEIVLMESDGRVGKRLRGTKRKLAGVIVGHAIACHAIRFGTQ